VVAHNGAGYLPETLKALASQTRRADLHIGADAGSVDGSAAVLHDGLPEGSAVVQVPARTGFGSAVRSALAAVPDSQPAGEGSASHGWIWLLHDDSAPEPEALQELLLAVERAPSVTVAGAKQVDWEDRRRLVDAGLSISRRAERLTLIDIDELDQGQYDARSDVFAVNSAGMLVRRDVWAALGGFDAALPGVGDDVDFCWRNRLAGHRVVVVPAAVVRHAASRPNPAAGAYAARKAETYLRLKHAPLWQLPFIAAAALLGGAGNLLLGLLAKDPSYGFSQFFAAATAVLRPDRLFFSRRTAARTRRLPRTVVRALQTESRDVRSHRKSVRDSLVGPNERRSLSPESPDVPSGDAQDDFAALTGPARSWVGTGALVASLLLAALAVTGLHRLVGARALAGGSLLPASPAPEQIWRNASSWWVSLGMGMPGHGDPFDYVLWLMSVMAGGNANAALVWLLLLALPLSALAAWFAAGGWTRRRALRFWAALFWAAVPALQVALGSGRVGALLVHVLLPLAALAMLRAAGGAAASEHPAAGGVRAPARPGTGGVPSWTAAAAAGLLVAALAAAAPSLLFLAAVVVAAAVLLLGRRARTLWWSLVPAAALFIPFAASALPNLRASFADPGLPVPFDAAAPWQQVLGFPVAFDPAAPLSVLGFTFGGPWTLASAVVVGAPVLALAAAALFLPGVDGRKRQPAARLLWFSGVTALVINAVLSQVAVAVGSSALIAPFTGPLVSAFSFAMLTAALLGADAGLALMRSPAGRRQGAVVSAAIAAGAVVLAAGPAVSLGLWTVQSTAGQNSAGAGPGAFGTVMQVAPSAERTLPATAADRGNSGEQLKTLVLNVDTDGNTSAALMRGSGTTLDQLSQIYAAAAIYGPVADGQLRADDDAAAALRRTVAVLVAGTGVDPRNELRGLGAGFVVLQDSDTAAELLANRIDAVPGLAPVGHTDSGWLWRVVPPLTPDGTEDTGARGAHARIVGADGDTAAVVESQPKGISTTIPDGNNGRTLVLAERSAPGWQATLDGTRLVPADAGWNQAFELPADGGLLTVRYRTPWEPWAGIAQAAVIAASALLAVPLPARRPAAALRTRGSAPRRIPGAADAAPRRAAAATDAAPTGDAPREPDAERDTVSGDQVHAADVRHSVLSGSSGSDERP
jgi:GT2 family glycosyltransferase